MINGLLKPTWTGLPDLPESANPFRDVEAEQEQHLHDAIGEELWQYLLNGRDTSGQKSRS